MLTPKALDAGFLVSLNDWMRDSMQNGNETGNERFVVKSKHDKRQIIQ